MAWSTTLKEPLKLADGRWLRTCKDVGELILALPDHRQKAECWVYTAQLLMDVATGGGDRSDLQLYLAQSLAAERMLKDEWRTRKKSEIRT